MTKAQPRIFWALVGCLSANACGGKAGQDNPDCPALGGSVANTTGGIVTGGSDGRAGGDGGAGTGGKVGSNGGADSNGGAGANGEAGSDGGRLDEGGAKNDGTAGATDLAGAGGTNDDACVSPRDGLVGWWSGDGNAKDAIGGEPGTLRGGVTFGDGQVQQAFSFDGSDDFVNLGNAPKLQASAADFTVEAWVRFESHQGDMAIADKMAAGGVNADGWRLLKQADDRFWFCFGGDGQNGCTPDPASTVYSTTSVVSEAWFHVAAVKTRTTFALYVNGKLEDERSPLPAFVDTNSTDLLLGATATDGAPAFLDGLIDEVRLFHRALSSQEIAADFECHRPQPSDLGLACAGEGLVQTVPDECLDDGGNSGISDALEVYCCGGTSRFCLTGEACPWRTGCTNDVATCSRAGLATDYLASAWCSEWNGHRDYYCGQDGQIRFVP